MMENLTPHEKAANVVAEVHATKPREKEYKMIGKLRPIPGLRLWSIDRDGKIEEVVIDRTALVGMDGNAILKQKAHVDPRKRYCQALNRRNAARKFGTPNP